MSEAPSERINISYVHDNEGQKETIELPLKFLMLGDYTGRDDGQPLEEREIISVDKDTFGEVLKGQNVVARLSVPNRLTGQGDLSVDLALDSIAAFGPDSIADRVPELKRLLDLRTALLALSGPIDNKRPLRELVERVLSDPTLREQLRKELGDVETAHS